MNTFETHAIETLADSGFSTLPLDQIMNHAEITTSPNGLFRYHTAREVSDDTHTIIYDINPYGARSDTPAMVVRRAAVAQVLGKGFALFGVEVSNPKLLPLTNPQKQLISRGIFAPFAYRTLQAMGHINDRYGNQASDADLALYGFSMGADVAAETSTLLIDNQHAGTMALRSVGIFDPARTGRRSRTSMVRDFASSGPDLFEEVIASGTDSLNQSRGIRGVTVAERRRFNRREAASVGVHAARYPYESLAVMSGFCNDMTTRNLVSLTRSGAVKSVVGRMGESTVCLEAIKDSLTREQSVVHMDPQAETLGVHEYAARPTRLYEYAGYTHAAADNLHKSAGFMLQTVMR